ncbi:MAG: tRNA lysidine(34) synthetase TilS [Acidobacteria bacterium]|nr:tRNA lysidine(34) synthetase TilS [Acidobacteriota bacterium]
MGQGERRIYITPFSALPLANKPMTVLEKKMRAALRRLGIDVDERVVIAVSGGADSTALLDALLRWRQAEGATRTITLAHLNHQLRFQESDDDEQFLRELATRLKLPIFIERITVGEVARWERANLEAVARRLRYAFLQRIAERCAARIVLTAHTRDDQVETIIMRLLRGAGPHGLRGIKQERPLGDNSKVIRPMLEISRSEVIDHCEHYGLAYRIDSSNQSKRFTRNRIRHELLPLLRTLNPLAEEAILRTAQLIALDDDFMRPSSSALLAEALKEEGLKIKPLLSAHCALRRRVLRMWLRDLLPGLQRIDLGHIIALENLIEDSRSGRAIELPGGRRVVRQFDQIVLLQPNKLSSDPPQMCSLTGGTSHFFGAFRFTFERNILLEKANIIKYQESNAFTVLLRECDELDGLWLRTRRAGDSYIPQGRLHRRKLKSLMINHKIPVSERDNYPVVVTDEDEIVWSPGLPPARRFEFEKGNKPSIKCALIIAEKRKNYEKSGQVDLR